MAEEPLDTTKYSLPHRPSPTKPEPVLAGPIGTPMKGSSYPPEYALHMRIKVVRGTGGSVVLAFPNPKRVMLQLYSSGGANIKQGGEAATSADLPIYGFGVYFRITGYAAQDFWTVISGSDLTVQEYFMP